MRSLLLLPLVACASLPEIRPCDPTGAAIEPAFINIGNDDLMIASIRWYGCENYDFQLCGVGDDWFAQDRIKMVVWHDDTLSECGEDEQIDDQLFNLYSLRRRYEKEFKVKSASMTLEIGEHEVPYSFEEEE